MQPSLGRLLRPRTVCVVGGTEAGRVIEQCDRLGFTGEIWPVNPERAELGGRQCHASVRALPEPPDAAFVAVPADRTVTVVGELAALGAGGAVCYASGFGELGTTGAARQQSLVEAAGGMPLVGPNCYGFLNLLDGVALWPDQHGSVRVDSGAAIITQSGNMGINLSMQKRALDVAYIVTLGNQAVIGVEDCVEALAEDPRVRAIGLHLEGLADPVRFVASCRRAVGAGKPVAVLKTGRSGAAARIALGHTASLVGSDGLFDALCARLALVRVRGVEHLLETLKLLATIGWLDGGRLASMSCSGGEAALVADLIEDYELDFPAMSTAHRSAVQATLNEYVNVTNPLDYHTFIWEDEAKLTECFTAMVAGAEYDLAMLIADFPRDDRCDVTAWAPLSRAVIETARRTRRPIAVVATMPESMPEYASRPLLAAGIAPLQGLDQALAAAEGASRAGRTLALGPPRLELLTHRRVGIERELDELETKARLQAAGIAVPRGGRAADVESAVATAERVGFPVAVKALGRGLVHKSDVGGVILDVADAPAVRAAAARLLGAARAVLVESMIGDGIAELVLGAARDEQLGLHLVVGAGGVLVELGDDNRPLLFPVSREAVAEAIGSLRIARVLAGYRGRPAGDVDAAIDATVDLARFVHEHAGEIVELDVNPLVIRPRGRGAVAADAYLRLIEEA